MDAHYYEQLEREHAHGAIQARLDRKRGHTYLGDAILGGIDGCVTTFAVVAGSIGGGFPNMVIVVLGFANLLADGFSMGVSNYLGAKSRREHVEGTRRSEEEHIDTIPRGERREIRAIFQRKGFGGETLEQIVDTITQDRELWVNTMIAEEHGLAVEEADPRKAGLVTFLAFLLVGAIPLLPFVLPGFTPPFQLMGSIIGTALAFFLVGAGKGVILGQRWARSGLHTLAIGASVAALAYVVGRLLREAYGLLG